MGNSMEKGVFSLRGVKSLSFCDPSGGYRNYIYSGQNRDGIQHSLDPGVVGPTGNNYSKHLGTR
jgi:hypothetical protein